VHCEADDMRIRVNLTGLNEVLANLEQIASDVPNEVDEAVERTALQMVNTSRQEAPRLTGRLANSIDIFPQDTKQGERTWGSDVEYARRQEYEHRTKSGYIRRSVTKHEGTFKTELENAVRRSIGGV